MGGFSIASCLTTGILPEKTNHSPRSVKIPLVLLKIYLDMHPGCIVLLWVKPIYEIPT